MVSHAAGRPNKVNTEKGLQDFATQVSQVTLRTILGEVVGRKSDWSGFSRVGRETLERAMSGDFAQTGGMNGVVGEKKYFILRWEK